MLVCVAKKKQFLATVRLRQCMPLLASVVSNRAHENHRCVYQKHGVVQNFDSSTAVAPPWVLGLLPPIREAPRVIASSSVSTKQNQVLVAAHLRDTCCCSPRWLSTEHTRTIDASTKSTISFKNSIAAWPSLRRAWGLGLLPPTKRPRE